MEMLNSLQVLAGKISPACDVKKENDRASLKRFSSIKQDTDMPDNDAIKMFVGQVPRSMYEDELKTMFEEFGPVHQINVLRDKVTGVGKGCCFVTYYKRSSAVEAQNALHNIKSLPGMHHPIQMKPADTENRNERKLFVGMVCKKLNEENIKKLFEKFGSIEECTILRDNNGISKGCAFVTFSSRQMAIVAIKSMHHSQTMEGCSSALVVKFADSQKEKEHKKVQQLQANLWNLASVNTNLLTPQYLSVLQQMQGANANQANIMGSPLSSGLPRQLAPVTSQLPGNLVGLPSMPGIANQLQGLSNHQQPGLLSLQHLPYSLDLSASPLSLAGHGLMAAPSMAMSGASPSMAMSASSPSMAMSSASPAMSMSPASRLQGQPIQGLSSINVQNSNLANLDMATATYYNYLQGGPLQSVYTQGQTGLMSSQPYYPSSYLSQLGLSGSNVSASVPGAGQRATIYEIAPSAGTQVIQNKVATYSEGSPTSGASSPNELSGLDGGIYSKDETSSKAQCGLKQHEGPEGANLFIYHLPQELSDDDLHQSFQPFGNIVSAKVFVDKQTNLSKCFGFVSYDSSASAIAAIQAMNGFQIGTKRLKVQLKRNKDASKPY